ncbi:MAG: T9SS type A sorting domain-containing protein [Bacteroidota bacterium]|nr:T9SS type A sorting domain-containing protein [Bacteroidota bacterium]
MLSIIIAAAKILPQESSKDFIKTNIHHQMLNQNHELLQHDEIQYPIKKYSFADSLIQHRLLLNKKLQMEKLQNVLRPQSNWYIVDTAIVRTEYDTSRYIYTYDESGDITEVVVQNWKNKKWTNTSHSLYTYDTNRNRLSSFIEDCYNDIWYILFRQTYTYDINGNQLSLLGEAWSENKWINSGRDSYTYDGNENQLSYLSEVWKTDKWVNTYHRLYTYDANDNMLSKLTEDWATSEWYPRFRETYTYDVNGNQLSYLTVAWTNNLWLNDTRDTYTYDTNGNQLSYLNEDWYDGEWVKDNRYTYTYDSMEHLISVIPEDWWNDQWFNNSRTIYTYDSKGNLLLELHEALDDTNWVNSYRLTYTYDSNGNQLSYMNESWINNQWWGTARFNFKYFADQLWSEGTYEQREPWITFSWRPVNIYFNLRDNAGNIFGYTGCNISLIYKLIVTEMSKNEEVIAKEYSVSQNYPNPFNPTTTINYIFPKAGNVMLKVYDVLGREVATLVDEYKGIGSYSVEFDASKLSSGMYFYKLTSDNFSKVKKMMLVK